VRLNLLALDSETTIYNKGHPFDKRNKLVCWSKATTEGSSAHKWGEGTLQQDINLADLLITFNGKFDLQWFVKEGIQYDPRKVWDVQLAEFIISRQTHRLPSLNEVCQKYGIPTKLDKVKEYWDKGIQTDDIPWEVLEEYAAYDAWLHLQCYLAQRQHLSGRQLLLFRLQCQDLSILREMEANGLPFDEELCHERAKELDDEISTLKKELSAIYPNVPINFGSNDHLSAFLYGGVVKEDTKEHVGFFKTGEKAGQPKYRNVVVEHTLPRLYQPLKGTEMAKEGNYSVDEGTLRKLKGKKGVIEKLLKLSKLEKLNGTYYKGLVQLRETMHWPKGLLHGNFNQTIAATGRLSSSKPNLQNFASELQDIFVSRV
jgi:DNA polymerase-1